MLSEGKGNFFGLVLRPHSCWVWRTHLNTHFFIKPKLITKRTLLFTCIACWLISFYACEKRTSEVLLEGEYPFAALNRQLARKDLSLEAIAKDLTHKPLHPHPNYPETQEIESYLPVTQK